VRKAVAFVQVESVVIQRGNACRVLPAMLQYLQAVIQQLVDRAMSNDT
jgi:hypothetical protein